MKGGGRPARPRRASCPTREQRPPGETPVGCGRDARPPWILVCALLFICGTAFAQQYSENFQSYSAQQRPDGWSDRGEFAIGVDPLGASNRVYTAKLAPSRRRAVAPAHGGDDPRGGHFATYVRTSFDAAGAFEWRGRFLQTADARAGIVFFSSYPETESALLIAPSPSMTLRAVGMPMEPVASTFIPRANRWTWFLIEASNGRIRAKFWNDGELEPSTFALNATSSLKSGRVGLWGAGSGQIYFDDLAVRTSDGEVFPLIRFSESGVALDGEAALNRDARIAVDVSGFPGAYKVEATLDGVGFALDTPITVEGSHELRVHASDDAGHVADAALRVIIDKTPPRIELLVDGAPPSAYYARDVRVDARITDTTAVTTAALLDGVPTAFPVPIAAEGMHQVRVVVTDRVGWKTEASGALTIDKTAPVIRLEANGAELSEGSSFNDDVTLSWSASDAALDSINAEIDGSAAGASAVISADGVHRVAITAIDKAGNRAARTRLFTIDRARPTLTVLANGVAFSDAALFNRDIAFTFLTSAGATIVALLDDQPYTPGASLSAEGDHTLRVTATGSGGLTTTAGPFTFAIDRTPPEIELTVGGIALVDGAKFSTDVLPIIAAHDNRGTPSVALQLDGTAWPLAAPITQESRSHTLAATATDLAGNNRTVGPFRFLLDKTPPRITLADADTGQPLVADVPYTHPVRLRVDVTDLTDTTVDATANGTSIDLGTATTLADGALRYTSAPITADAKYVLSVSAVDAVGLRGVAPVTTFSIDAALPAITITAPAANALLTAARVTVEGTVSDATNVSVNGQPATYNAAAKTFHLDGVALLEGANDIVVRATRASGQEASATRRVTVDTRSPELAIGAPAANACVSTTELSIAGTASDASLLRVKITAGSVSADAVIAADRRSFAATVALPAEGALGIRIEAIDTAGHSSIAIVPVTVDRTKPVVEVVENGLPFHATAINRPVALFVRSNEPNVAITATLDGQPYANGMAIAAEGTHELRATARDCAGHGSDEVVQRFTIDRTAPQLVSIAPARGSTVANRNAITGVLSEPASLVIDGTGTAATMDDVRFTLNAPLEEGPNTFSLLATDAAGNQSVIAYDVRVDSTAPSLEIVIDGAPIPPNAVYARVVAPAIRANEAQATITATLLSSGGTVQPFTSGTSISADGSYTIAARAVDPTNNQSAAATASFRIDRTAPSVKITSPANGARIASNTVEVRGTTGGGDVRSVSVNNTPATLAADGTFNAAIPLDFGPAVLTAVAVDTTGNSSVDSIEIVRDLREIGLVLTSPPDRMMTNRPSTVVAGQVLTASAANSVMINGTAVPVDAAGVFRKTDFALAEGTNAITASVTGSSASVVVTADFTAPPLKVRANGADLADGARFAASPAIALESETGAAATLTIDGEIVSPGVVTLTDGGHALTAIARDAAGNETRVDRVFFIGTAGAVSGCSLANFDPPSESAVFSETVRISDGTSCFDATLVPGRNEVKVPCPGSDAPVTLVLHRFVDAPIAITSPAAGTVFTSSSVTVSGTVGAGVISGDVNGIAFTIADDGAETHSFSVPNVPLAPGLNVLTARAVTKSARVSVAGTRVKALIAAPQLAITSPLTGTETGALTIDVTGTYTNADPATIKVTIGSTQHAALSTQHSETSGTFRATVPLPPAASTTITATARNAAGAQISASVTVQQSPGNPSISIDAPADNTFTQAATAHVTGTFTAEAGSQVSVNGIAATVNGSAFAADVELTASASGITPVIARVTAPDARGATDSIRITRFADAFAVRESFPANDAAAVERGAAIIVLFNHPLDGSTAAGAIRVVDANGANVDGETFVDRDVISFAPHQPLRSGTRYSVSIATSLRDVAGASLAAAHSFSFTSGGSAPASAPIVDDTNTNGCFSAATITGRASTGGARVRLDVDGVVMTTVASDTGAFKFTFTFSGRAGTHVARVRELGGDGSLSAERALCYRIDCATPQVLSATLDRAAKTLTIQFSKPMDLASLNAAIVVTPETATTIALDNSVAVVTLAAVPAQAITLTVKKTAKDTSGASMVADYTQTFAYSDEPALERGKGYVTGAVYDATNGRPLAGARVILSPAEGEGPPTDSRGRYTRPLPEGAYTIEATAPGYTTVWRQVVVPAGAGVVPIDIRLTKRGDALTHGGETKLTKRVELALPSPSPARITSLGAQSLAGLLPLGWSPLASAEISGAADLPGAKLTFFVDIAAITNAAQTLSLAQYESDRDEWRVVAPVVNVGSDGRATIDISTSGNYALVYADKGSNLVARGGATLAGVANPCATTPDICKLTGRSFTLEPKAVLPNGRTVATLIVDGAKPFPSGTAVQAFIDEQLNLADGRVLVDPPFATDLLIYRSLAGTDGVADFHLAPTAQATAVMLRDGVDHIRIVDYPGRVDRGTLLGPEGGRIPGDDGITIDVPAGATAEPLHAVAASITDLAQFGAIAGFRVVAGFTLTLTRASEPATPEGTTFDAPRLLTPARAILSTQDSGLVVEVLSNTPFGVIFRMVVLVRNGTTLPIDSTQLPLDGIVRDGRYLVIAADAPIAYAYGQVRNANGVAINGARVTSDNLGVRDLTRLDGLFVVPVAAKPAAPFTLIARTTQLGDGAPAVASASPDPETFVNFGTLTLAPRPPVLQSLTPANNAELDAATVVIQATFDMPIDPTSIAAFTLNNVAGTAVMSGANTIRFNPSEPLRADTTYTITVGPTIRGVNGAPFGRVVVSHFTTRAIPQGNTSIHRERIRITLPDTNGKSTISGIAGALPNGARAIVVRRGRLFIEVYQTDVAADGSFSFDGGHRHVSDRITTADAIDLQVLDPVSHAITAIIELTPFVSADNKAFLAPANRAITFTSADGITVSVPAGAFDTPTLVRVEPAAKSALADVPSFDSDLNFSAAIRLDFAGIAKERLEVDFPAPANTDPNKTHLLARLGDSMRGPKLEIIDFLRVDGSKFTTRPESGGGARSVQTHAISNETRRILVGTRRPGMHAAVDLRAPVGWSIVDSVAAHSELYWHYESLFVSTFALVERRGSALIPVPANQQFTIVGVDSRTGLDSFRRTYDPIPAGPPSSAVPIPSPVESDAGPLPVFATPARVELVDFGQSVRDVQLFVEDGALRVKNLTSESRRITIINAATTSLASLDARPNTEENFGPASADDRFVVALEEDDVDPDLPIAIVFDQPIFIEGEDANAFLHSHDLIRLKAGDDAASLADITDQVTFRVDSNGRRIELQLNGALQRGKRFALILSRNLAGAAPNGTEGLKLAQRKLNGTVGPMLPTDLVLWFHTREPGGEIRETSLANGVIRDFALHGNVAVVSALTGGLQTFDLADPAALDGARPAGRLLDNVNEYWAVTTDRHGRIFSTGMTSMLTYVRSYRIEDFLPDTPGTTRDVDPTRAVGSAMLTWRLGFSSTLPIGSSTAFLTDRPEAVPRKMQLAVVDREEAITTTALATLGTSVELTDGFRKLNVTIPADPAVPYQLQRITIENRTLDLRWSADAPRNGSAQISGILAREGDALFIVRNVLTYGVVSLFGYGIGVFDLNAVESNDHVVEAGYQNLREKVALTDAKPCTPSPIAPCAQALIEAACQPQPDGVPCPIRDLSFTPDALVRAQGGSSNLLVYALESNRGVLDVVVTPPTGSEEGHASPSTGLALGATQASQHAYHPRLRTLTDRYIENSGGRRPRARFTSIAPYKDYALIATNEFGLVVLKLDGSALTNEALADVVWIPAGAISVRVLQGSDIAVVVDGAGRVLLFDLKRIDERARVTAPNELFPTALASIRAEAATLPPDATWSEVGADDPRIIWKSKPRLVRGTLPPLVDPDTGFVFTGDVMEKTMRAVAATDPRIRAIANDDGGEIEISGVVPLGVEQAQGSLSAFRLELMIPGAISLSLAGGQLAVAVESERIAGTDTDQTLAPLPPAHLRPTRRDGSAEPRPTTFVLRPALPSNQNDPDLARLRYQSGFNRLISDWIVAIADPRASKQWSGARGGCASCERPAALQNAANVHELYTAGRFIAVRAAASAFAGSGYNYLGQQRRIEARLSTIAADTVRDSQILVAAQQPPVADGLLQETTYLHSGEVESNAIDLDAGGRAGWNVIIDRTYRSRTIGTGPFGAGWESALFRRLRVMPNGNVEYRDGAGETWTFKPDGDTYVAPQGLFLRLARTDRGWNLIDQKLRSTSFDDSGALVTERDEFYDSTVPGSGNEIRYFSNERGQLARIIDPLGRVTTLTWNSDGFVSEIRDWRGRIVNYIYNGTRLIEVRLPETANTTGVRPAIRYAYQSTGTTSYNDQLEIATNVETITDPGNPQRVQFSYETSGANRDRITRQQWGSGESATFTYTSPTQTEVRDALGQIRKYTLAQADAAHATEMRETSVPVFTGASFGQLPATLTAGTPGTSTTDSVRTFSFAEGTLRSASLAGVRSSALAWQRASGAPGLVVQSTTTSPEATGNPSSVATASIVAPPAPITRTFHYQPGSGAFLDAVAANGKRINNPEPHRYKRDPSALNSAVREQKSFDRTGQITEAQSSGGTDTASAGARSKIEYFPANDPLLHRRGMPKLVRSGDDASAIETKFEYPDPDTTIETDARGVETKTTYDTWRRPVRIEVKKPGDPLVLDEKFFYDAPGRLVRIERKKGSETVTTSYTYDVLGRQTSTTQTGIAIAGGSVTTSTTYDLPNRRITTRHAGGATTTTDLDTLGRVARRVTQTGSSPIEEHFAYDLDGNRVFATDTLTATATAFDAHGRAVAAKYFDGTVSTTEYDAWSRPKRTKDLDDAAQPVADTSYDFTDAGTLREVKTAIDAGTERATQFAWDGAKRTTSAATNGRASKSRFDIAGRILHHAAGAGDLAALSEIFTKTEVTSHSGSLPAQTLTTERSGDAVTTQLTRNTTGDVTTQQLGPLEWKQNFDELGNVTQSSVPGRPSASYDVDARGSLKKETLPDGAENDFAYHASGAQSLFEDPVNEATSTETDLIGRPLKRTYADGTTEIIEWESTRIKSVTDRQGRNQSFTYNAKGQLTEIRDSTGTILDALTYDSAGRLVSWKNKDSEIAWSEFDLDGNPKKTTQKRFRNETGHSSSPEMLDEYTQQHRWNEHGERAAFSMPAYASLTFGTGWSKWIREDHDAMGNVVAITKVDDPATTTGTTLMTARYRNAGRPDERTVFAGGTVPIIRTYGYHSVSSLMNKLAVTVNGLTIAGSEVTHDGLQKSDATLLGISGGNRHTKWRYDARSRLAASLFATSDPAADPLLPTPGRAEEKQTPADFRTAQERVQQLSAAAAAPGDPPSKTISERSGGGHKIAEVARGPKVYPFGYAGAEVIDDGRFTYEFDAKGRLIRATEKTPATQRRRIVYTYSGTNRLIGRRAEYATVANPTATDWKLEDRAQIIRADGLPPETTFVWDAISDRLITVAKSGATTSDAHGGILKQILHGGLLYDDPVETSTVDPLAPSTVNYLYPIYDEAGAGSLQTVLNKRGELVARNLNNDPFGGEDVDLAGASIERVSLRATRNSDGSLSEVSVEMRSTEAIAAASLAAGTRLAASDASGAPVRISTSTPTLADANTIRWTLSASEYATLTDGAAALSIGATKDLRAAAWGADIPILPAPEWATGSRPIFTSSDLPIEVRESLASLSAFLAGIPNGGEQTSELFEVEGLALLGTSGTDTLLDDILSARMHGHPFTEPLTGLDFVRARWYQPLSGTWLTPDPLGYEDSPNMYAFGGGDPVNNRDPQGEGILDDIRFELKQHYTDVVTQAAVTAKAIKGIAKSVGKTVVGTVAAVNLIHEASKPGNVQAQLQVLEAAAETRDAVAQWGTSAGEAIAEPELIGQALNELSPEEFAEETFDSAVTTSALVTPLAGVGGEAATARAFTPRMQVNLARPKAIQSRPANVRFGPARGGGGDELARAYAYQVTNSAEKATYVNGVEFEGIQRGVLVDAKRASGAGSFYDISGTDSFTRNVKVPKILQQARRQLGAVQGEGFVKGIRWEVADAGVAQQLRHLFVRLNIRITVVHNPALQ